MKREDGLTVTEFNKCEFDRIVSRDARPIHLVLNANSVSTDTKYNVKFSIKYDFSGTRLASIPIIDPVTKDAPSAVFSQSDTSPGPIALNFQAGELRESIQDGKKVTGYWLEYGRTAELKINLAHVGSSSVGMINDTYINVDTFWIDTKDLLVPSGLCHFREREGQATSGILYYCRNINQGTEECDFSESLPLKVPIQLICNLETSRELTVPEVSATVVGNFDYTYKFTRIQPITVRDVPAG